jgi:hypothetical protein
MTRKRDIIGCLVRDERGTSTIEATLVLPVVAICWAAVLFQFKSLDSTLTAAEAARRDAWQMSAQNCNGAPANNSPAPTSSSGGGPTLEWLASICEVPVLGEVIGSLLGYSYTSRAESEPYKAPNLMGGGTHRNHYTYYIMCNDEHMTASEILRNTVCKQMDKMQLDFDFALDCPPDRHAEVKDFCAEYGPRE